MAHLFDITLPIREGMLIYPGNPGAKLSPVKEMARGDTSNVAELCLGTHTGTHVDAPIHMIEHAKGVESFPLDSFVGPAHVVDATDVERDIDASVVERAPRDVERILFKTHNSQLWEQPGAAFPDDFVAVTPDGAKALVDRGARLVGTDFLSIEHRNSIGHPTHVTLLDAGVVIVEGLDLSRVEPGDYTLVCLPLLLVGGDGAPARALLIAE